MPEPELKSDGCIFFGKSGLNIKRIYGVGPEDFIVFHEKMVSMGFTTPWDLADYYVIFELYCRELYEMGYNLFPLIDEFNIAQNSSIEDISHIVSLTKICYHYTQNDIKVEIKRSKKDIKTPDLIINDVSCDLKVRHDQLNREMVNYMHLIEKDVKLYHNIRANKILSRYSDLVAALESRAEKGFRQAECIIFDLSSHFHSWNFHRIKSYVKKYPTNEFSEQPLKPIPGVCIIFSPDNANDMRVSEFVPKAFWTYVVWDIEKREFIDFHKIL